ncbi:MAG: hypothetical protein HYW77_03455 [Parcubacteria group bacterium]|nr:hypothetical protein [Parcubacteria group bacterium]
MSEEIGVTQNIEQEIAALEQSLADKKASLQQQHSAGEIEQLPQEKEILREVIGERISEGSMPQFVPPVQPQQDDSITPSTNLGQPPQVELPSYLSSELHEPVQNLVNTAFTIGLDVAIKQAKATNNAALIDAFHDVLADELYNYLVERGRIQQLK